MKKLLNEEDERLVCELYKQGQTQSNIAKKFNCSRTTIVKCLKDNSIKTRTANHWAKRYKIDEKWLTSIVNAP